MTQPTQPTTTSGSRRNKRGGKKGNASKSDTSPVEQQSPPSPPQKQQQSGKKPQQKRLSVAAALAGKIIGQGGATVKDLQARSGCNIMLDRSHPDGAPDRVFVLQGRPEAIAEAERLILWTLQRARESVGGGGVGSARARQTRPALDEARPMRHVRVLRLQQNRQRRRRTKTRVSRRPVCCPYHRLARLHHLPHDPHPSPYPNPRFLRPSLRDQSTRHHPSPVRFPCRWHEASRSLRRCFFPS